MASDQLASDPSPTHHFDVQNRHRKQQKIAGITAHVLQADLLSILHGSVATIRRHLQGSGVVFDDEFWVLFHRVVSPDSDGPIEICIPFAGAVELSANLARKNDPTTYGVGPGLDLDGPAFIRDYAVRELAHRQRQELLLWDSGGAMGSELGQDLAVIDEVAAFLVAADAGDDQAEQSLTRRYAEDDRLHPGGEITHSPYGEPPQRVRLERLRPVA